MAKTKAFHLEANGSDVDLGTLAARRGVLFGAAITDVNRLPNTVTSTVFAAHSTCMTFTGYGSEINPSDGVVDLSRPQQMLSQVTALGKGSIPKIFQGAFYPSKVRASPTWMLTTTTADNVQARVQQYFENLRPIIEAVGLFRVGNEFINYDGTYFINWLTGSFASPQACIQYLFEVARDKFPNVKLLLGETGLELDTQNPKKVNFIALCDVLLAVVRGGRPLLDGVICQGHLHQLRGVNTFSGTDWINNILAPLRTRAVPIYVTEFDIRNTAFSDIEEYGRLTSAWAYRFFSIALAYGVRWFNIWDINPVTSSTVGESINAQAVYAGLQRPSPWDALGKPTAMERAIRAALT